MTRPTTPRDVVTRLWQSSLVRFLLGGVVTYSVTLTLMAFWIGPVGVQRSPAYALTHVTVLIVGFLLNRRWVFRATAGRPAEQGVRFVLAQGGFRVIDWLLFTVIESLIAPPVFLGVLAANLLVLPAKYLFYRNHVFAVRPVPAAVPEEALRCPE
jgi:putative flippase GtrA